MSDRSWCECVSNFSNVCHKDNHCWMQSQSGVGEANSLCRRRLINQFLVTWDPIVDITWTLWKSRNTRRIQRTKHGDLQEYKTDASSITDFTLAVASNNLFSQTLFTTSVWDTGRRRGERWTAGRLHPGKQGKTTAQWDRGMLTSWGDRWDLLRSRIQLEGLDHLFYRVSITRCGRRLRYRLLNELTYFR